MNGINPMGPTSAAGNAPLLPPGYSMGTPLQIPLSEGTGNMPGLAIHPMENQSLMTGVFLGTPPAPNTGVGVRMMMDNADASGQAFFQSMHSLQLQDTNVTTTPPPPPLTPPLPPMLSPALASPNRPGTTSQTQSSLLHLQGGHASIYNTMPAMRPGEAVGLGGIYSNWNTALPTVPSETKNDVSVKEVESPGVRLRSATLSSTDLGRQNRASSVTSDTARSTPGDFPESDSILGLDIGNGLELSAGAKPFVPRFSSAPLAPPLSQTSSGDWGSSTTSSYPDIRDGRLSTLGASLPVHQSSPVPSVGDSWNLLSNGLGFSNQNLMNPSTYSFPHYALDLSSPYSNTDSTASHGLSRTSNEEFTLSLSETIADHHLKDLRHLSSTSSSSSLSNRNEPITSSIFSGFSNQSVSSLLGNTSFGLMPSAFPNYVGKDIEENSGTSSSDGTSLNSQSTHQVLHSGFELFPRRTLDVRGELSNPNSNRLYSVSDATMTSDMRTMNR